MSIAWFTPFTARSAIGEFSQHVTGELAELADVEIWTSDDAPLLETHLPLVGYHPGSKDLKDLKYRDAVVYNIGNHLGFHRDIYRVSSEHAGVVILHDRALQHLFSEMWLMGSRPDAAHYIERMGAFYGQEGADVATAAVQGRRVPPWESEDDILRYPLFEESIVNALGVVAHSEGQASDVRAKWLGPVASLHLPCYADVLKRAEEAPPPATGARLRLLTMGHLNPNKQVHAVVEMLTADPALAAHVEYRVAGPDGGFSAYRKSLERLIGRGGENLKVEILGWLGDAELEREMELADAFMNLRHPNIEGSSASLMKQLAYGRPVICFDTGVFGELPKEAVVQVAVGDFMALAEALRALVSSVERRVRLGNEARALAASFSERSYAEGVLHLIEESRRAAPALRFLDSVGRELGDMDVDGRLPIFDEIANDFARILEI